MVTDAPPATPRHWLWVTSGPNWEICRQRRMFGFDERYRQTLERFVHAGDLACVYVTGHKGVRLVGLVGVVCVVGKSLDNRDAVGWKRFPRSGPPREELYPHRLDWEWVVEGSSPVRLDPRAGPRLEQLEYFTDKSRSWYSFVYPSIARLPEADVQTVISWMRTTANPKPPEPGPQ